MDDAVRGRIKDALSELDSAENAVRAARAPFDAAIMAVETARDSLLTHHAVEIAGTCESCSRLLFVGDKGFRCDDGPVLCEKCGPTYGDVEQQWDPVGAAEDPERFAAFRDALRAHLIAGGKVTDQMPSSTL